MYFMVKEEKIFDRYMEIWGKVSNLINEKVNSELINSKKYLIAKKHATQKKAINAFIEK